MIIFNVYILSPVTFAIIADYDAIMRDLTDNLPPPDCSEFCAQIVEKMDT